MDKPYIQVRISPTLRAHLKVAAESRRVQATELIRMLIVNFCDQDCGLEGARRESAGAVSPKN
jgi:hypothetical protein